MTLRHPVEQIKTTTVSFTIANRAFLAVGETQQRTEAPVVVNVIGARWKTLLVIRVEFHLC